MRYAPREPASRAHDVMPCSNSTPEGRATVPTRQRDPRSSSRSAFRGLLVYMDGIAGAVVERGRRASKSRNLNEWALATQPPRHSTTSNCVCGVRWETEAQLPRMGDIPGNESRPLL